jgi:hypothetical protein
MSLNCTNCHLGGAVSDGILHACFFVDAICEGEALSAARAIE